MQCLRSSCAVIAVRHYSLVEKRDCPLCHARGAPGAVSADCWRNLTCQGVPRQVCDRLEERRGDLAPFIDEDFDAYVAAMRQPHAWGGEPELSVAADVLSRPVHVRALPGTFPIMLWRFWCCKCIRGAIHFSLTHTQPSRACPTDTNDKLQAPKLRRGSITIRWPGSIAAVCRRCMTRPCSR